VDPTTVSYEVSAEIIYCFVNITGIVEVCIDLPKPGLNISANEERNAVGMFCHMVILDSETL
jgi:hypothetical protein